MAEDAEKKDAAPEKEVAEEKAEQPVEAKQEEKPAEEPKTEKKADEGRKLSDEAQEAKDVLGSGDDALPEVKTVVGRGRKAKAVVPVGIAHIKATFNNTMVSITDPKGGVIAWSSAGKAGFKGSRKSTAFAATLVAQDAARQAMTRGLREVEVRVQGAGSGRESAVRALQSVGLTISVIKDITPVPHNGCRARKRRRV
ncbi:30S ribosomal protein S11 [bacterium E08(2017)]|nr:30S ribosomal protein S11 [bacterium E08(2017)]